MVTNDLVGWKDRRLRKLLLLTGVRQCGKTYILREFGHHHFGNIVYLNFQTIRGLGEIFFGTLEKDRLLAYLGALDNTLVVPGETFVILNEIQRCLEALALLKFFAEEMLLPNVATRSLPDVKLARVNPSRWGRWPPERVPDELRRVPHLLRRGELGEGLHRSGPFTGDPDADP